MKNKKKGSLLVCTLIMGLSVFSNSCSQDNPKSTAVLTTTKVTEITQTTAVSGGTVTNDGGVEVSARGVCWSTNQSPSINDSKTANGKGKESFTGNITSLTPNTLYYVRAYATNSVGTSYGEGVSFKTLKALEIPTLTTTKAYEITQTTAVSGGNVTDDGGASVTARGVCWSTNQLPTINDSKTNNGEGKRAFISNITGLALSTTYYVRAYATNTEGTAYGNEESFITVGQTYSNPVISKSLPDPTIIKAKNGYFYLYATEDIRNTPIHKSKDLVNWEFVGTAFTDKTRPTFEPKGGLWAPEINYINDKYVLHYSMSVWGGEWTCGIGVATADKPEGPFTDHGKLFRSNEIDVQNSIDQFYIEEGGKKYLFWGSFRGIYAIELTDDALSLKPGAMKQQIAGTYFEATNIHKRNGFYYMFASIGSCCAGLESTYTTVVGRSKNLFGPYLNKSGQSMLDNKYELVIQKNAKFLGTGHNSKIVQDSKEQDWMLYHAISVANPKGRVLMLDQIKWKDDWPYVQGNTPSLKAEKPVF